MIDKLRFAAVDSRNIALADDAKATATEGFDEPEALTANEKQPARKQISASSICCCMKCRFVFESVALPDQCPDCGHGPVRAATESESAEYAANRRLYGPMPVYGMKRIAAVKRQESAASIRYAVAASY